MSGIKRDRNGNSRQLGGPKVAPKPVVRNAYTPMFENFRDELDEHHDRRDRLGKVSRDVTALSKKVVRQISPELPADIQAQVDDRLTEIASLLAVMAPEVQGLNRHRYARTLMCLEELIEALSFAHYLKTQRLITTGELTAIVDDLTHKGAVANTAADGDAPMAAADDASTMVEKVFLTANDYVFGIFDLTGEMMRFATTSSALMGAMASSIDNERRTIVQDMQALGSFFEMLPRRSDRTWTKKMEVLLQSVKKVEKLGYDRTVRGSERPAGWVPDLEEVGGAAGEGEA